MFGQKTSPRREGVRHARPRFAIRHHNRASGQQNRIVKIGRDGHHRHSKIRVVGVAHGSLAFGLDCDAIE